MHRHRAVPSLTRTTCYDHCLAERGRACHPAAHGGVCEGEECRCGAVRVINCNGLAREASPWRTLQEWHQIHTRA